MSALCDGWLHSLSQDGAYPHLLEGNGNVKLFEVTRLQSVTYHVWSGDAKVYGGASDVVGYDVFYNETEKGGD